ncbi:hypothetical protein E0H93_32055 [Rhizobium leguminosarum bv. viciae]|uniref:hypothetical protein n=1 Tax=Rhizobium leguminosarum TaxID=384 RepID=UPI00103DC1B8|nr:hypothetical protein [Rhizobium leguminosarum]TBY21687.1 hypothetical protein E0H55_34080 [Rhizobium leguminosarum bv. viciae]TCA96763.1 hypothetical protein E0H93_32055 [Rhizobium leguminosarum bv. viciae]
MRRFFSIALLCAISACASRPPQPTALIPVARVVNSLKCEFAKYLTEYRGERLNLHDWGVAGTLTMNVATSGSVSGDVSATGLVPFQGASAGIGVTASVTQKYTTTVNVDFELESKADSTAICAAGKGLLVESGIGFGSWLTNLGQQLDQAAAGHPKFAVSGLDYELVFALERSAGISGNITVIPLALSAEALATRNDVQTLKVALVPPQEVIGKKKDGTPITRPVLRPFGLGPTVIPQS